MTPPRTAPEPLPTAATSDRATADRTPTDRVEAQRASAPRAPYTSPRLVRFGTVDVLTRNVGNRGLRDKAGSGRNKTR